jgi:prepilin-type N-terminal cleavage/methylation domain-containing protein/prepilin-type processing-associated H-X9-DG protein
MRNRIVCGKAKAFTLIELIVVIAAIALLIGLILPWLAKSHVRISRIACTNNLKQVSLSFRLFATDNDERFPMQVSTNAGGTKELVDAPYSAFRHFLALSNELGTSFVVVCPKDQERVYATNWANLGNRTLSYFVGLNAMETNAQSILSGDRYLTSSRPATNGFLVLTTNDVVRWTKNYHTNHGNLAFGDGSVTWPMDSTNLQRALRDSGSTTNRLALPE